jgi:hypothetical protein
MNGLKKKAARLLAIAFATGAATAAHASIVTFGSGAALRDDGYTEAGMQIERLNTVHGNFAEIRDWASTANAEDAGQGAGERELILGSTTALRFSLMLGGAFDLESLDIEYPRGPTGGAWSTDGQVRVTGSNGAMVDVDAMTFATTSFGREFQGLAWFTLSCAPPRFCQGFIDNIVFTQAEAGNDVPVSGTLGLSALGLVLLARRGRVKPARAGQS